MESSDLERSFAAARARLEAKPLARRRRQRSDAGRPRIDAKARALLSELLSVAQRPHMHEVLALLKQRCRAERVPCPSRAASYNVLPHLDTPMYRVADLPDHVGAALYNLDDATRVSGAQLAFYLMNHGDTRALSFAAAMPWLCLYQAERMRGFRPKSHALLRALLRARRSVDA